MSDYDRVPGWWDGLDVEERREILDDLEYWEGELDYGWNSADITLDYDDLNSIAQEDIDRAWHRGEDGP